MSSAGSAIGDLSRGRHREPHYNNPYLLGIERVWFDRRIVSACESGDIELQFDEKRVAVDNKVAQEYQVVYAVDLDEQGKLAGGREPERVEGRYNIYDSVPGMDNYSPLWQFNYVIVPRDYEPNTLRSVADCLDSGFPIERALSSRTDPCSERPL